MNAACIDIRTVAMLTGEDRRRVWERIDAGEYTATKQSGGRGGTSGESYLVAVSSLPRIAQIIYMQQNGSLDGSAADTLRLTEYRERFGEAGLKELLGKQRACQEGLAIRTLNPTDVVEQLTGIAEDHGTTLRTLYRWMDAYAESGLPGIMRAMKRRDAGTRPSMCPAAYNYAYGLYMNQVKRTTATIYKKLEDFAAAQGASACRKCIFCDGTASRRALMLTDEINHYPACTEPEKTGMKIPACRQTLSRILAAIPEDEKTLARRGKKAWKDDHMLMAMRAKPEQVNEVWFGDHHQMDAFVLDKTGKPIRPWLTMWYDAATGCPVGWVLCESPNTQTIIEAFNRAVAHTKHSPFYGVPRMVYVDNGKDYRSKLFETGMIKERDLGFLNGSIATNSVLQLLNIQVTHALPYLHRMVCDCCSPLRPWHDSDQGQRRRSADLRAADRPHPSGTRHCRCNSQQEKRCGLTLFSERINPSGFRGFSAGPGFGCGFRLKESCSGCLRLPFVRKP
jgi:putative transposase